MHHCTICGIQIVGAAVLLWIVIKLLSYLIFRLPKPPKHAAIFITGAGTGIGKATALLLNEKGFHVYAGVFLKEEGDQLLKECKDASHMHPIVCDVTSLDSLKSARAIIEKNCGGKLWGLVNNAGINISNGPVEFLPLDRVRQTFEVNVMGIYNTIQVMMPLVRAARGRVVNIGSVNSFISWEQHSAYCMTKHGVLALTDALRLEIEPFGCFASIIEPGGIDTQIWDLSFQAAKECCELMGPECANVYGRPKESRGTKNINRMRQRLSNPTVVADAIHHSLSSSYPKFAYIVGSGSTFFSICKRYLLTDYQFHVLMRLMFGKGRRGTQQATKDKIKEN